MFSIDIGDLYHSYLEMRDVYKRQGEHHFTKVRPYDQSEFDALNAQINQLRSELERNDNVLQLSLIHI